MPSSKAKNTGACSSPTKEVIVISSDSDSSLPAFVSTSKYSKKKSSAQPSKPAAKEVVEISSDSSASASPAASNVPKFKAASQSSNAPQVNKRQASDSFNAASEIRNKKARDAKEGSPAWDIERSSRSPSPADAPPVTIINATGKRIFITARNRSPSFGQFDQEDMDREPSSEPSAIITGKRKPIPSEKVRYMQDEDNKTVTTDKASSSKKKKTHLKAVPTVDTNATAPKAQVDKGKAHQARSASPSTPPCKSSSRLSEINKIMFSGDKDDREGSLTPTNQRTADKKAYTAKKEPIMPPTSTLSRSALPASGRQMKGNTIAQEGDESDTQSEVENDTVQEDQITHCKSSTAAPIQREAEEGTVHKEDRDVMPAPPTPQYESCTLESFLYLKNHDYDEGRRTPVEALDLKAMYDLLQSSPRSKYGARNLLRFYVFTSDGDMHNPSRASASSVFSPSDGYAAGRIVSATHHNPSHAPSSLFLTNGCVNSCELVIHGTKVSGKTQFDIKRIGIWTTPDEFESMISFFGKVFRKHVLWGNYSNDVLTFSTQKDGATFNNRQGSSSAQSSPTKPAGLFTPRKEAPTKKHIDHLNHPHFLKFSDNVPIYDLRDINFKVTLESISKISELPRYQGGISDLKPWAIVTVGYTANLYPYKYQPTPAAMTEQAMALSLNVQFVLFHGDPPQATA